MICKRVLALFFWCHCYQIVLIPLIQLFALAVHRGQVEDGLGNSLPTGHRIGPFVAGAILDDSTNSVALTPGHDIKIHCSVGKQPDAVYEWYRVKKYPNNETPPPESIQEQLKNDDVKYIINNNAIIIRHTTLKDVGDYYCKIKEPAEGVDQQQMIYVRAKPHIHEFNIEASTPRSAVIMDGQTLRIPCNVADDYAKESDIRFRWEMSKFDETDMNSIQDGEDGIRINYDNSTCTTLVIDRVTKNHRRFYKCTVSNGYVENSKSILIRVKDQYMVLWPSVGIVIELVILIGVIVAVENRKVEPDKDTYNAIQM